MDRIESADIRSVALVGKLPAGFFDLGGQLFRRHSWRNTWAGIVNRVGVYADDQKGLHDWVLDVQRAQP